MTYLEPKLCTLCGSFRKGNFLFQKVNDNNDVDSINIFQCGDCKNVYLGKYNNIFDEGLYSYYNDFSGKTKDQVYDPLTSNSYLQVFKLLKSYGCGNKILDVGCGYGSFVDIAIEQGYSIMGIDLSKSAVNIAKQFNLPVHNIDFFSSKIKKSSFDVLSMFEVIEHLPEPVQFLKRAEQVVKPGGLIYITTPNFNSLDRRLLGKNWRVFHREHLTYFTPATIINAVNSNTEFEVLHLETRNISSELIAHLRHFVPSFRSKDIRRVFNEVNGPPSSSNIRTRIANSAWLSLLKQSANFILDATGLGSTIVIILRRKL